MSVTVATKPFHAALQKVATLAGSNKGNPALACVEIAAADGVMTLVTTDLDIRLAVTLPASGNLPTTLINCARMLSVAATIKERGEATIAPTSSIVELRCGRSRFTLEQMAITDGLPSIDTGKMNWGFSIGGKVFSALMSALEASISTEEVRYYLRGVFLHPGSVVDQRAPQRITAVATNGVAMGARDVEIDGKLDGAPGIIVPRDTCIAIARLFADAERLAIRMSDLKLTIDADDMHLVSKLVEGHFPDWRRVMPSAETAFAYDTKALVAAIEVACAATDVGKAGSKGLKLGFGEDETELVARDLSAGSGWSGADVVPHSRLQPSPVPEIGVNGKAFARLLIDLDVETVELVATGQNSPILVRGAARPDRAACIMPMRV